MGRPGGLLTAWPSGDICCPNEAEGTAHRINPVVSSWPQDDQYFEDFLQNHAPDLDELEAEIEELEAEFSERREQFLERGFETCEELIERASIVVEGSSIRGGYHYLSCGRGTWCADWCVPGENENRRL